MSIKESFLRKRGSRYDEHDSEPIDSLEQTRRKNSLRSSFLAERKLHPLDSDEDVEDDVLYPQFLPDQQGVDMGAFQHIVQERKKSMSSLKLTKTLSKQGGVDGVHRGVRFVLYSPENAVSCLEDLLTDQGQKALTSLLSSKRWWLDVLCPTMDEMRTLSKTFRIHPLTTEDIQAQESREKVEPFSEYTFVCFRAIDVDPGTGLFKPYNFYNLIYENGFLTFHFHKSKHADAVRQRCDQLKEHMLITPEWMNYALIDSITDSFAPIILDVETEAVSIDELSLVLKRKQSADMLKRISNCRKKSTQLVRLLTSKLDVIKSLMKRCGDKRRNLIDDTQHLSPIQLTNTLHSLAASTVESKKTFSDVLLYLGDIQDHVVTMVQNINHYDRILHRAHTNYLAHVNLELTHTYNMTNSVMNRLTFLATVFIPLTVFCSLWGMNVHVPGQNHIDDVFFFWILMGMTLYCISCILFGKRVGIL